MMGCGLDVLYWNGYLMIDGLLFSRPQVEAGDDACNESLIDGLQLSRPETAGRGWCGLMLDDFG